MKINIHIKDRVRKLCIEYGVPQDKVLKELEFFYEDVPSHRAWGSSIMNTARHIISKHKKELSSPQPNDFEDHYHRQQSLLNRNNQ